MSQLLQFGSHRFDPADVLRAEYASGEARVTVRTPAGQETFVFSGPGAREEFVRSTRVYEEWLRAKWHREGIENWRSAAERSAPARPKLVAVGNGLLVNPEHITLIEQLAGGRMRVHLGVTGVAPVELDAAAAEAFWHALRAD